MLTGLSYQSCSFYPDFCWHSHNVRFIFVSRKLRKLLDTSISFYLFLQLSTMFYKVLYVSTRRIYVLCGLLLIGNQCWTEELWSCVNRLRLSIKDLQSLSFEKADTTSQTCLHLQRFYFTLSLLLSSFSVRNPSNIIATLGTVLLPVTLISGSSPIPNSD